MIYDDQRCIYSDEIYCTDEECNPFCEYYPKKNIVHSNGQVKQLSIFGDEYPWQLKMNQNQK